MARKLSKKDQARLDDLIAEATADCCDEGEAHMGFVTMLEENVVCPFKATVIGEEVEVVELRATEVGFGVGAVCRYKGKDYRIHIHSLGDSGGGFGPCWETGWETGKRGQTGKRGKRGHPKFFTPNQLRFDPR
jgi:hypothetical protein